MTSSVNTEFLIAISAETPALDQSALRLANQFGLPIASPDAKNYAYLLMVTPGRVVLNNMPSKSSKPICVDFLSAKLIYRQKNNHRELLKKTLGSLDPSSALIVDATAGFGEDAFVLAHKGYRVIMLERSAVLAMLLQDGLARLYQSFSTASSISLELIHQDARIYLPELARKMAIDVVYLDPMFPERKKSALPRKEMEILRNLVGNDADAVELLQISLKAASNRVIVKRPRLAKSLGDIKPTFSVSGKISRFDVYSVSACIA